MVEKNNVFVMIGDEVLFQPSKLPNEPELIKIHNNIRIAADVTFYTHDVINKVFSNMDGKDYGLKKGCIEIYDNCFRRTFDNDGRFNRFECDSWCQYRILHSLTGWASCN